MDDICRMYGLYLYLCSLFNLLLTRHLATRMPTFGKVSEFCKPSISGI